MDCCGLRPLLERELQCKLDIAWIAGAFNTAEICPIADIAVGIQELCVIENVEKLGAEFKVLVFADRENFLHGEIKIVDAGSTTNRPWGIAQQLKRSRSIGLYGERE